MNQQQLREDLNRMADRRIKQFREEQERTQVVRELDAIIERNIPTQTEWQPNWTSVGLAAVACALFFACVWYFGLAIAQQAGF